MAPSEHAKGLQKAAGKGRKGAQFLLAACYLDGTEGLEKDAVLEEHWLRKAGPSRHLQGPAPAPPQTTKTPHQFRP